MQTGYILELCLLKWQDNIDKRDYDYLRTAKQYTAHIFSQIFGQTRCTLHNQQHKSICKSEAPVCLGTIRSYAPVYSRRIQK